MNSALDSHRSTLWAALGYVAIVGALFHRLLLGEVLSPSANLWTEVPFRSLLQYGSRELDPYLNGIQGDVWRACEPWHIYQYRSAREGRFPLWNPHVFCGFPFHANAQSAMLSPFHWLYFVVDPKWAAGPVAALKLWVTGFAAFWLGRRLGMLPSGAFLAGAAWMLCAFNVRWLLWNLATATAWLPVVLLATDVLVERPTLRRFALAGLAVTGLQLSGHPECQFLVGALAGLYALLRVWFLDAGWRVRFARLPLCLAIQIIGLCGAAAALLPFVEQMRESVDWQEATHALRRHLPPEGVLGAIAPDHFGRPRAGRIYHDRLGVNYVEAGMYIGVLPLALAITATVVLLVRPRRTLQSPLGRATAIFGVTMLLCAAVVLGVPGVAGVVHRLPLFSKADTLRLLLGVQFAGAMLAGAAWSELATNPSRLAGWVLVAVTCAIAAVLGYVLLMPRIDSLYSHLEGLRVLWTDPSTPAPLEHRSLRTLVSFAVSLTSVGWAVACVRWVGRRGDGRPPRWLCRSLVFLAVGDLCWVAYAFNPIVPSRVVFPEAPKELARIAEELRGGRIVATGEILAPNLAIVYDLRDLRGYDFPLDTRWATLFRRLGWIGRQVGITLLPRDQVVPCVRPECQSVFDKCAVRVLYTNVKQAGLPVCGADGEPVAARPAWLLVPSGRSEDAVYQNPTVYPRAYFAHTVAVAEPDVALDALLDLEHDLREQSFVEQPIEGLLSAAPAESPGEVTFEQDGAEEVTLRTRSSAAALLVLADRYDPNWRVEIDDQPARAVRANYLFRGVMVPSGEHVVRWRYRPASFLWGCVVSAVSLVALLVLAIAGRGSRCADGQSAGAGAASHVSP